MNKILIVEDDPAVQSLLIRLFESEGYDVEVRADGNSALEAIHAITPMAIVLDLQLPAVSGKDICRQIKSQTPAMPVIVLSAITNVSEIVAVLELGADDYVTKPFNPRELLARVRRAIGRAGLDVRT